MVDVAQLQQLALRFKWNLQVYQPVRDEQRNVIPGQIMKILDMSDNQPERMVGWPVYKLWNGGVHWEYENPDPKTHRVNSAEVVRKGDLPEVFGSNDAVYKTLKDKVKDRFEHPSPAPRGQRT